MYDRLDNFFLESYKKYEYDVKVCRARTFVRGQRRTKVRPCGRTLRDSSSKEGFQVYEYCPSVVVALKEIPFYCPMDLLHVYEKSLSEDFQVI